VLEGLVERARNGDESAFEDLTRMTGDHSMAVAGRILPDRERAERAVEAAFTAAWRTIPRLRESTRFEPWLDGLVLEESVRQMGTIRRLRRGPDRAEPASLPPAALSEETLEAIGRRVARTRQLSERAFLETGTWLRVTLFAAVLAAIVVASGQVHAPAAGSGSVDAANATLPPDIVAALARPTFAVAADGAPREGDVAQVPDFSEPLSFTVPRLPDGHGRPVDIDLFDHNLIVLRSGASLIAIHDHVTIPADLCRSQQGSDEDALSSAATFESWVRRATGIALTGNGSFEIDTGTVHWIDVATGPACRGSFFLDPSERHRLLLVPGRHGPLLVMTGRDAPSFESLSQAAVDLIVSMRFQ
jgi:DNA-directed RNA polymerase specialized sigma24 family protein